MVERRPRLSVRARLFIITLLPILVLTPLLLGITMQRWLHRTDHLLGTRVSSDLIVAHQYLDHLTDSVQQQVRAFAGSVDLAMSDPDQRRQVLDRARKAAGFDFLQLSAPDPGSDTTARSGLQVLTADALEALEPGLAARARIPLIPTPGSDTPREPVESRGLVAISHLPITLPEGGRVVLSGGILLNRNDGFIDQISDLVYPASNPARAEALDADLDHGVISLFLDESRIATTLRPDGQARALGTQASSEVSRHVLDLGEDWQDTAFVVSDWYISAYQPLRDIDQQRIGMIYAGIPEAPFKASERVTFVLIGLAFLAVVAIFVPMALVWTRDIFRPVEAMGDTIRRVEGGDATARTGPLSGAGPELRRLSEQLDVHLDQLATREADLLRLNETLNSRVEERTRDLSRASAALEAATRELIVNARLATIGEVTAGVAHEINNPLAVISGNLEILRMVLGERTEEAAHELALIEEQVDRINRLVNQMLNFTRPAPAHAVPHCDPARVLASLPPLVAHHLTPRGIMLDEHLTATGQPAISHGDLQQILINLIANAAQAMGGPGTIRVTSRDQAAASGEAGVLIEVEDDGPGIDPDVRERLFEPFYTTRSARGGTGLGLTICLKLVSAAGGHISAESRRDGGTDSRFDVWLPLMSPNSDAGEGDLSMGA